VLGLGAVVHLVQGELGDDVGRGRGDNDPAAVVARFAVLDGLVPVAHGAERGSRVGGSLSHAESSAANAGGSSQRIGHSSYGGTQGNRILP
jgi:hypothetical protein